MGQIVVLQEKLFNCGFITDDIQDRHARHEITKMLKIALANNKVSDVVYAVEQFAQTFSERRDSKILRKAAYFQKVFESLLEQVTVDDIKFEPELMTKKELTKVVFRIIDATTIPYDLEHYYCFNIFKEFSHPIFFHNPFDSVTDRAFKEAKEHMFKHKEFYEPLIDELLEMNKPIYQFYDQVKKLLENPVENEKEIMELKEKNAAKPSIGPRLKEIEALIEKGPETHAA